MKKADEIIREKLRDLQRKLLLLAGAVEDIDATAKVLEKLIEKKDEN